MSAAEVAIPRAIGARTRSRVVTTRLVHVASLALFAALPIVLTVVALTAYGRGWDFRAFYLGARAYLSGNSPYPNHSLVALATKQGFVYPAPIAALLAPLALLPYGLSFALWLAGSIAAVAIALRILGVRDWRCFGALFLTYPMRESVRLGTLMPLLLLLLALLWKHRDRLWRAASLVAVLALSKVFLFPLMLWLVATRRWKTAGAGAVISAALCLLAWLPIHLSSLAAYPGLLHALASFESTFSYSLTSLAIGVGITSSVATAIAWAAGAAVVVLMLRVGRGSDFLAFRLALAASFLLSPIVWGHYYILLAVPLALRWPRFGPVWLAAIWIRSDTLALRAAPLWVGLALLVLLLQLDLLRPLMRRLLEMTAPRTRVALGLALVLGILTASEAAAQTGYTRNAALRPAARQGTAGGAAQIRIDRRHHSICWRLWTEALPARRAAIAITGTGASAPLLLLHTRLGQDGQAQGCARIDRSSTTVVRGLIDLPTHYTIVVAARHAAAIIGTFRPH